MDVTRIESQTAAFIVTARHYLHRKPPISYAFGLWHNGDIRGVITFGVPASNHLCRSACPTAPENVIELNRLWVADEMLRNTESAFIARALAMLPPRIVVSYADTAHGHMGYVYRASNFYYAGWTDMERKTPRFDYVVGVGHSRGSFRGGRKVAEVPHTKVPRLPKVKYWTVTGNRRDRAKLERICGWPRMDWKRTPPPAPAKTQGGKP